MTEGCLAQRGTCLGLSASRASTQNTAPLFDIWQQAYSKVQQGSSQALKQGRTTVSSLDCDPGTLGVACPNHITPLASTDNTYE